MSLDSASFSRLARFLVVVVALLFAGPPAAQAAPILDQSFLPDGVNDFSEAAVCDLPDEFLAFHGRAGEAALGGGVELGQIGR